MPNELHQAAAEKGGLPQVQILLKKNPDQINLLHTKYLIKPAEFAAQHGDLETVQYLIMQGADLDSSCEDDKNLLFWATRNTQDVIAYVADPNNKIIEKFNDGTTYFQAAVAAGKHEEVIQELEQNSGLAYSSNDKGQSALYWSLITRQNEMSNTLINYLGAEIISDSKHAVECKEQLQHAARMLLQYPDRTADAINLFKRYIVYCSQIESVQNTTDLIFAYIDLAYVYLNASDNRSSRENIDLAYSNYLNILDDISRETASELNTVINETKAVLSVCIEAEKRGFKCIGIKEDGACFYYAMLDQLEQLGNPKYANLNSQQLRERVVKHLRENIDEYKYFIASEKSSDENVDSYIQKYLQNILKPDYWADHVTITALSREFNMTFYILRSDGAEPQIIKPLNPCATLNFGYLINLHYLSLHPEPQFSATIAMQKEIDSAATDDFQGNVIGFNDVSVIKTKIPQNTLRPQNNRKRDALFLSSFSLTNSFSIEKNEAQALESFDDKTNVKRLKLK